ncbi:protein ACCELERATED CELL DEATH 6-like [Brassica napus]|uniref:protein ACCELERATED CELL DEATH 6-like n=1 Tax=Brassica napus TaxID=3708 RepID=UPI00207AA492|nr:protein ACCELERATED CELL DEATH 6-like [Brassica napus]
MGKSDIEIAVLRHRKARIRELRHRQLLHTADVSPPEAINYMAQGIYMVATQAAPGGHAPAVVVLINHINQLPLGMQIFLREGRQVDVGDVWVVQNNEGNTALHLALKANHQQVALLLVGLDQRVSFVPNEERASPLYMAAEAGDALLVGQMLNQPATRFEGKSVVHAAIKSRNIAILNLLLVPNRQNLFNARDEEKRSVLSYAASVGYDDGVQRLLQAFENIAYVRDPDGFFPIHSACRRGHLGALQAILQSCPDTIELLNLQGQNVLHVAAECGKTEVVKYILRNEQYANLINQKDHTGNTPLHLATVFWYPMIVHILTKDERVNVGEQNKLGFTALDAAEECMDLNPTFRERLTWMALVCVGTPRALKLMPYDSFLAPVPQEGIIQSNEMPSAKKYKDRVNTLLLLAILVATVAFSAGFSVTKVPEGEKHWYKPVALQVFVVSNTIAMYSSVLTTVALIWAQLGDLVLILNVFKVALPLLGIALIFMSFAFLAGMFVVVGNQLWLHVLLLASGGIFLGMLVLLVVPFVCPYTSKPSLFRYVWRYPFWLLLMLIVRDDNDDDLE